MQITEQRTLAMYLQGFHVTVYAVGAARKFRIIERGH
jgi:hypothetical protein